MQQEDAALNRTHRSSRVKLHKSIIHAPTFQLVARSIISLCIRSIILSSWVGTSFHLKDARAVILSHYGIIRRVEAVKTASNDAATVI